MGVIEIDLYITLRPLISKWQPKAMRIKSQNSTTAMLACTTATKQTISLTNCKQNSTVPKLQNQCHSKSNLENKKNA
jgi:hypothetical protein